MSHLVGRDLIEIPPLGRVRARVSLVSSLVENPMFTRLVCHFCGVRPGEACRERYEAWLMPFECFTLGHGGLVQH